MDQLTRAMQDTEDLEQLSHVLEAVLSIFGCDRAWLAYPDTGSRRWQTVAQRACPEFADTPRLDLDLPTDTEIAEVFRLVEASEVALRFGAGGNPLSSVLAKRFGARLQMCLAVHLKIGKPYTLGLDQCASPHIIWTGQEQELFEAAGMRLATLLTSLLLSRDLQESKARLEEAQRAAHVGYWDWNIETNVVVSSDTTYRILESNGRASHGLCNGPSIGPPGRPGGPLQHSGCGAGCWRASGCRLSDCHSKRRSAHGACHHLKALERAAGRSGQREIRKNPQAVRYRSRNHGIEARRGSPACPVTRLAGKQSLA
jgi:hypothetical protein